LTPSGVDGKKFTVEQVDKILQQSDEVIIHNEPDGSFSYSLNRKGRTRIANQLYLVFEKINYQANEKLLAGLKHYVETGTSDEDIEKLITVVLPTLAEKLDSGLTGDEVERQLKESGIE